MMHFRVGVAVLLASAAFSAGAAEGARKAKASPAAQACVTCHRSVNPQVVTDWQASRHAVVGVGCSECHGVQHTGPSDVAKVVLPSPDTCARCHEGQVAQFKKGKHALAWAAVKAMPTFHYQPLALREGLKGCGSCHKLGIKSAEEQASMKAASAGYGNASCDACHTRHTFSKAEARRPEACQTCHMGPDHAQWETYSSSKHGVRNSLKAQGALPATAAAPTCQTCHMGEGNHEVRTAWGLLAVRAPLPENDPQWAADRATILQALGVLDPAGKFTGRLEVVKAGDVARLTQEAFDAERSKMLKTCTTCHASSFAKEQLGQADNLIRDTDHVVAEAIRIVAGLYKDGILKKPDSYAYAFPDLLQFHDAPTPIELQLSAMVSFHRAKAIHGAFHANPDYVTWYGWGELTRDIAEIRAQAEELRRAAGSSVKAASK